MNEPIVPEELREQEHALRTLVFGYHLVKNGSSQSDHPMLGENRIDVVAQLLSEGYTHRDIGGAVGWSRSHTSNMIRHWRREGTLPENGRG